MLIRQSDSETVLQCDSCGAVFYADTNDTAEARLLAEADGWTMAFENEQHSDYCQLCEDGA